MTAHKKVLAIVANAPSPYRVHQHTRIVRELGDKVELWSVFLHEHNWQPWTKPLPEEIRPIHFDKGESMVGKNRGLGLLKQWQKMGRVIQWLEQKNVDVVISTGYNDLGLMRLIAWCKRTGVPNYMFSDSNVYGDRTRGVSRILKKRYLGWVLRSLSGLMPCGTFGQRYYEPYGGAAKPCFFMPHEPDYGKIFAVTPEQRLEVQKKFGLSSQRRYIMYSGRLAAVKRVDTLIDAYARIAAERPEWDLLLVGGGALEAELRSRVPAVWADRVVWTGFINDAEELSRLYTCGDVFVLPSSYEPWAVVVCEAAAAGLPIVASEVVGAAGELCREGVNGATFPAGDVDALSRILLEITQSEQRLTELRLGSLRVLDDWRRRGDPVQGVRLALAHAGLLDEPPPVEPTPPTPRVPPSFSELERESC